LDIQVDPKRRCFCRHEADFALQALVECRAFEHCAIGFVAMAVQWQGSAPWSRGGPVEREDAKTRCAAQRCVFITAGPGTKLCVFIVFINAVLFYKAIENRK
jgi:hypothetical protein